MPPQYLVSLMMNWVQVDKLIALGDAACQRRISFPVSTRANTKDGSAITIWGVSTDYSDYPFMFWKAAILDD